MAIPFSTGIFDEGTPIGVSPTRRRRRNDMMFRFGEDDNQPLNPLGDTRPPEEKTPAAVTLLVPHEAGHVTPYKVQIDPDRMRVGGVSISPGEADTSATRPRTAAPASSASDRASDNVTKAYEDLRHAETDPAKKEKWYKSGLESLFAGLQNIGPIRDQYDLAQALTKAGTMGAAGLIKHDLGSQLMRPYRIKLAEQRLKIARDVATTQAGIEKKKSDEQIQQQRLGLQQEREKRLSKAHDDVNKDRDKKNLISEWKGRQDYDPDDPEEAENPNSLTHRAAAAGMTLGTRAKEKKTRPEFTSGGIRYWVDENNEAHPITDKDGEVIKDQDYEGKIKYRNARLKIAQSMLGIAQSREKRLTEAQKDKRGDRQAKIEADAEAGQSYKALADDFKRRATDESDPAMQKLYLEKAAQAEAKATGLSATSRSQVADTEMRALGSEKEFRAYFSRLYKEKHNQDPSTDEVNAAAAKWKEKYGKK